ncbi:substrate-binding periplasmic protein [Roseibium sp.]|uniref:substrate-binding periplasmic protein n=1 Tax=Roseibium sp. TaxID=1936156 RepID=UPI003B51F29D
MRNLCIALCLLCALAVLPGKAQSDPVGLTLVTQSFAPLQFAKDNEPAGYVADFLLEALNRVNNDGRPVDVEAFEFLPWKRAMLMAETQPNTLFFSLSRTPEREDKFIWLGEVSPYGQYLYQLKRQPPIQTAGLKDLLKKDYRIGVQRGSSQHSYFQDLGVRDASTLVHMTSYQQGIDMLYLGRIDLLPLTGFLSKGTVCARGHDGTQLQPVVYIKELAKPLWAVFSKGTDPELVAAVQEEMKNLREEGFWEQRFNHHVGLWQEIACDAVAITEPEMVSAD